MTVNPSVRRYFAVCVGINNYHPPAGLGSLRYAEKDAQDFYELLLKGRFGVARENTCLLTGTNATLENINSALATYIINNPESNDAIIFYFAGHSEPVLLDGKHGSYEIFLAPYDFDRERCRTDRSYRLHQSLSLTRLRELLFESREGAERRFFILDSCYSGAFTGEYDEEELDDPLQAFIRDKIGVPRIGRVALSSCLPQQKAFDDHERMTYHMLTALRGEAPDAQRNNGSITVSSLFEYLTTKLTKQRPVLSGQQSDAFDLVWFPPKVDFERIAQEAAPFMVGDDWASEKPQLIPLPPTQDIPNKAFLDDVLAQAYQGLDIQSADGLRQLLLQCWKTHSDPATAHWPQVAIGMGTNQQVCTIQLDPYKDNAHLIIGGATGSGKTEYLITIALGLAVHYPFELLRMVLIDYKDGEMLRHIKGLPHCIDAITGSDAAAIQRFISLLRTQLRDREQLFVQAGVRDIVAYNTQCLTPHNLLPHLVVIISEGTDLLADFPDLASELDEIARKGRLLGLHLLFGTRLPTSLDGKVLQGIRLRIRLRRDGAVPGRGYVQIGQEAREHVQLAYSGNPFKLTTAEGVQHWSRFSDAIVATAQQLVEERPLAPWAPPLPTLLPLMEKVPYASSKHEVSKQYIAPALYRWLHEESSWPGVEWGDTSLTAPVGLIDNVVTGQWAPLKVHLAKGHTVLYGAAGWGKTSFLRSLAVSLAAIHSPQELHLHIFDMEGRSLEVLRALPHVGTYITINQRDYVERVQQFLHELEELLNTRQQTLQASRTATLTDYNAVHPKAPLPAIVVMIDNIDEMLHTFSSPRTRSDDGEDLLEDIAVIARQGLPAGVHIVATCKRPGALSSKLFGQFVQRLSLKLNDPRDYIEVLGKPITIEEEIPGRGYMRTSRTPVSFQIALISNASNPESRMRDEVSQIRDLGTRMFAVLPEGGIGEYQPVRIEALPSRVMYRDMIARWFKVSLRETNWTTVLAIAIRRTWDENDKAEMANWLHVPIGIRVGNRDRVLRFDARYDGAHGLIVGGTGSGKSETLITIILGLALNYSPNALHFIIVDYKGGGTFPQLQSLPHVVEVLTNLNLSSTQRMFMALRAELEKRQLLNVETGTKTIVEYRSKGFHHTHKPYPFLLIVIDEYAEMIANQPDFIDELEAITRLGRAQGVVLILSAQRPTGISDQMRANIKLHIGMRVETTSESREIIRRADAAFLPNDIPGRAYIQVGNGELELFQTAYTGEHIEGEVLEEEGDTPTFAQCAVAVVEKLFGTLPRPQAPWPPALPKLLAFDTPFNQELFDSSTFPFLAGSSILGVHIQAWLQGEADWPSIEWGINALRVAIGVVDHPRVARQTPLVIDFNRGHTILFGASGWGKTTFIRILATALAATHNPALLHMHIIELGGRNAQVLAHLPHVGTIILSDAERYEESLQQFFQVLSELIDQRKELFSAIGVTTLEQYNQLQKPSEVLPVQVILIDNIPELLDGLTFTVYQQRDRTSIVATFIDLLRQGRPFGVHFAVTASRPSQLSSNVYSSFNERLTLRLAHEGDYSSVVGNTAHDIEAIAGRGFVQIGREALAFQLALLPGTLNESGRVSGDNRQIEQIASAMHRALDKNNLARVLPFHSEALPKSVLYRFVLARSLGLPQQNFSDSLYERMQQLWQEHRLPERADWLQVPIGIVAGNRERVLQLEAKRDGVHALIAGGTGSGKSELLTTLIVGLAIRYGPDTVNFLLIDYKGGGAFAPFQQLPHSVDVVTNLDRAAVYRMFTSIQAEIQRRQGLNVNTATKDIVEYRRKGLHISHAPYPHLVIIIDEYAEMISSHPEFRAPLESITRVGRAQGINLILASQRPIGVTDQMRANIKLRICLRVEQVETSNEMLRRSDAAFLPNNLPGRGYLQVGNEGLELIQIGYTGEIFADGWNSSSSADDELIPRFFEAIVGFANRLTGGQKADRLWPDFLPEKLGIAQVLRFNSETYQLVPEMNAWLGTSVEQLWRGVEWARNNRSSTSQSPALTAAIGLVDDPEAARQFPLTIDLLRGHLAIFGDSGSGKTTLLQTLLMSLAATHSPEELHFYVLDFGGRSFGSIEMLPHMGAILYAADDYFDTRLQRLFDMLGRMIDERQQLMNQQGVTNIGEYNAQYTQNNLPAIVICIDNFAELRENYEALIETSFVQIARRSLPVGIHFVITATTPSNILSRLYSLFTERLTFHQTNVDRYYEIVGRIAFSFENIPGRGYIRINNRPLLFQSALTIAPDSANGVDQQPIHAYLQSITRAMQEQAYKYSRNIPEAIKILPENVALSDLIAVADPTRNAQVEMILGQDVMLKPLRVDLLRTGYHLSIIGSALSGKTTTLFTCIISLTMRYAPEQVKLVLIDMQRGLIDYGGLRKLDELPHVIATASTAEQIPDLVSGLETKAKSLADKKQSERIFVFIDNFVEFSEDVAAGYQQRLAVLARRYARDGLHFIMADTPDFANSELRRRILASRFGLGLGTAQAVETFRVSRIPAEVRVRDLAVGRGYIIRSGTSLMVQVASPYYVSEHLPPANDSVDQPDTNALALDQWVERIIETHSAHTKQRPKVSASSSTSVPSADVNRENKRWQLLRLGAQRELEALRSGKLNGNGDRSLLAEELLMLRDQENSPRILELLYELLLREQEAVGVPRDLSKMLFQPSDEINIIYQLELLLNGT